MYTISGGKVALQGVHRCPQLVHGLGQYGPGTGGIEPHEALELAAKGAAVIEAQLGLFNQDRKSVV